MDKLKAILKSTLFGAIMLLFLALSAIIAKALKLSANRTYIFEGSFMLLSLIVPLLFVGSSNISFSEIGFNKPTKKIFKDVLYYLPLVVALVPILIFMRHKINVKSLVVMLYFYGCLAIAAEVYFRGLIQHFLRGKFNIIIVLAFASVLFALCNLYYLNRITYIKHILVLSVGSFALAGICGLIIEKKGLILFTIIFDALYLLFSASFIKSGKNMILGQGISCIILLIYGLYMLVFYFKEGKTNKQENKEEIEENSETVEDAVLE